MNWKFVTSKTKNDLTKNVFRQ